MSRVLLTGLALVLAACSGGGGDDASKDQPGGSSGNGPGPGPTPDPAAVCGESKLGTPKLRRLTRGELTSTLNDVFPGVSGWTSVLSADPISKHGFDNDAALLVVGKQTADELDRTADAVGAAVSGAALQSLLPCSATTKDAACAAEFIGKYGKRLFRRALSAEESGRYAALFQQVASAKDFATGIRFVTRALVQSPYAVYRSEIGAAQGGARRLAPHEVAAALAYNFSGTAPSEALLARAEAGELSSPAAREAVARELLLSDKGLPIVERFFNLWLGYGHASSVTKPNVQQFDALRSQMVGETQRFLGEVVITQNGGLKELLTAPFTTPSASLAQFYGFPAPSADYAVTARPAGRGVGILAQGALLATLSGPAASSPTKRGLLVMERLLCRTKPTVPADVPDLKPPEPGLTTRQRYEESHASGSCKACHQHFDPIGFGFEHFDEAGRYRENENGLPINAASYVPGNGGHLFDFASLEELAHGLAAEEAPYECASGFMSTYVFGGTESCLGETKRPAFVGQQLGFVDYFASLAAEPHFVERRAQ